MPENDYTVMDPRGDKPPVELVPLADRVSDLNGKSVCIINSMPHGSGMDDYLKEVGAGLMQKFPQVSIVQLNRGAGYMRHDPDQVKKVVETADAYIYGCSPTGSLTAAGFIYAVELEKAGKPGVAIVYTTLTKVALSMQESLGIPVRYTAIAYPPESMSEPEQCEALEKISLALIAPLNAEEKKKGPHSPPKHPRLAAIGSLNDIQDYFYKKGFSDGLPIIPPTEEKVAAMLEGTSHKPDEVLTEKMPPAGRVVTVEKVAVNAVMAGCKPETMPVLLAAVEGFVKSGGGACTSTNSFSIMQVLNGPIIKELEMNFGSGALSPGNQANAAIGRMLTFFKTNLGGGEVDVNMMGVQGNPSNYAFTVAENEDKSPWESFSVEKGFRAADSTLSVFIGGWSHVGNYYQMEDGLACLAKDIAVFEYPNAAVALIAPPRAKLIYDSGMSKQDAKTFIWKNATATLKEFRSSGYFGGLIASSIKQHGTWPKSYITDPDDKVVPVYPEKGIEIIVLGGDTAPMMQGWKMSYVTTVSIDKWR